MMINNPKHSSNRVHDIEGVSPTINTVHDGKIIMICNDTEICEHIEVDNTYKNSILRKLTHIECERLQGYCDDYTKYGRDDNNKKVLMTDKQRYKQLGNSVTVNVINEIVKNIDNKKIKQKSMNSKIKKDVCDVINKTIKLDSW